MMSEGARRRMVAFVVDNGGMTAWHNFHLTCAALAFIRLTWMATTASCMRTSWVRMMGAIWEEQAVFMKIDPDQRHVVHESQLMNIDYTEAAAGAAALPCGGGISEPARALPC